MAPARLAEHLGRAVLVGALLAAPLASAAPAPSPPSRVADTYTTRGVIKGFARDGSYVRIAHEAIPGYMEAMTMSFHPRRPDQLAGFKEGDRVRFAFTEAEGYKRFIDWIERAP